MTDDDGDLRARLARLDPARPSGPGAIPSRPTHEIRERVMQTIETAEQTPTAPPARRRHWGVALGAAAAAAAVVAGVALTTGDGGSAPRRDPTTLTLQAPGGLSTASCVAFDVTILREMPVAFGGTVVETGDGSVTIDVDRWYKGGDADRVTLENRDSGNVSIEGVEFTTGARYLVTATEGTVNSCGFTGPATPQLEAAFQEAFGGA